MANGGLPIGCAMSGCVAIFLDHRFANEKQIASTTLSCDHCEKNNKNLSQEPHLYTLLPFTFFCSASHFSRYFPQNARSCGHFGHFMWVNNPYLGHIWIRRPFFWERLTQPHSAMVHVQHIRAARSMKF